MPPIPDFVQRLAQTETPPHVHNPYAGPGRAARTCRANVRRYLEQMAGRRPRVLLVGEAPGYRGCCLTGVPLTSEAILLEGVPAHDLFGPDKGYTCAGDGERLTREQTATIVWDLLRTLRPVPLLWNALPFHPHRPGHPRSNRTPRVGEVALGRPFLGFLLNHFPIETVIAAGNKAAGALARWDIPTHKVRHPSHGGKAQFTNGLQELLENL